MRIKLKYVSFINFKQCVIVTVVESIGCSIPKIIRGAWFSWEKGQNTLTELNAETMSRKGYCVDLQDEFHVNYTLVFKRNDGCYTCIKFLVRTVNVLEKMESMFEF